VEVGRGHEAPHLAALEDEVAAHGAQAQEHPPRVGAERPRRDLDREEGHAGQDERERDREARQAPHRGGWSCCHSSQIAPPPRVPARAAGARGRSPSWARSWRPVAIMAGLTRTAKA
jgi:hypothetical protein